MERLVQRFVKENKSVFEEKSLNLKVILWANPSQILCCGKGIIIFIEENEREVMYEELCGLLMKVS